MYVNVCLCVWWLYVAQYTYRGQMTISFYHVGPGIDSSSLDLEVTISSTHKSDYICISNIYIYVRYLYVHVYIYIYNIGICYLFYIFFIKFFSSLYTMVLEIIFIIIINPWFLLTKHFRLPPKTHKTTTTITTKRPSRGYLLK